MASNLELDRDTVVSALKRDEAHIRALGVSGLWLFGSVARNEAHTESDVDLFCEYDKPRFSLIDLIKAEQHIGDVLDAKVDLATRGSLRPDIRSRIEATAIRVF